GWLWEKGRARGTGAARVRRRTAGAGARASPNGAWRLGAPESRRAGPKPGELPMARARRGDNPEEARTVPRCKAVGGAVGRGDMPSEPGDSWVSPKCIEVQPRGPRRSGSALFGRGAVEATDPR